MEDTPADWRRQALERAIRVEAGAKYGTPDEEEK